MKECECGCGREVKPNKRFLQGHSSRNRHPWNYGLTKGTSQKVKMYGEHERKTKKILYENGTIKPWNKNLSKETDSRVKRFGECYPKIRKAPALSQEVREKKRGLLTGENNPNFNPNKTDFEKYKIECKFKFNLGDYPEEFDIDKVQKMFHPIMNKKGYTRDHLLSIYDGFSSGIPANIVSHPANCSLILHAENSSKNKKSSISAEQLYNRIDWWKEKYA